MDTKPNHAAYGGSFDPPTNGHLWVIRTAAARHEHLTVFVAKNAGKSRRFDAPTCTALLRAATAHLPNVTIAELPPNEFLVREAKRIGAQTLVRAARSGADFEAEFNLAQVNRQIEPSVETVVLVPPPELASLSSSTVMSLVGPEGWEDVVEAMVPEPTMLALEDRQAVAFVGDYVRRWLTPFLKEHCPDLEDVELAVEDLIDEVIAAHDEPSRRYHRLPHIARSLKILGKNPPPEMLLAILFHDSVYRFTAAGLADPGNETESAHRCRRAAERRWVPEPIIARAALLIRATAEHFAPSTEPRDGNRDLMLDIDLAVFGDGERSYRRYARRIRDEYGMLSNADYIAGRLAFLRRLRSRKSSVAGHVRIVRTEYLQSWEAPSRKNIDDEIARLEAGEIS